MGRYINEIFLIVAMAFPASKALFIMGRWTQLFGQSEFEDKFLIYPCRYNSGNVSTEIAELT